MTSKQIVKEFLNKPSNVIFPMFYAEEDNGGLVEVYEQDLKDAIKEWLVKAMEDGYKQGHLEAEAAALYDVTIGGHKDW
jgi:hypothetical protein